MLEVHCLQLQHMPLLYFGSLKTHLVALENVRPMRLLPGKYTPTSVSAARTTNALMSSAVVALSMAKVNCQKREGIRKKERKTNARNGSARKTEALRRLVCILLRSFFGVSGQVSSALHLACFHLSLSLSLSLSAFFFVVVVVVALSFGTEEGSYSECSF